MSALNILSLVMAILCALTWTAHALDDVSITEFMAANSGTLLDEDGDASDWLELHNAGTNTVNLNGWFLTDDASDLTRWRLPSTNLSPNAYVLVFTSGKDRRVPGAPLHTSFQLRSGGEYLALIKPDGSTVASAFGPAFPTQVSGVSYGLPVQQSATTLLATGATARVLVPADGALGEAWTMTSFNDSLWTGARTGVGFETDGAGPFVAATLADSVAEFSGTQGQNNWSYGYWDRKNDANGVYAAVEFVPFPSDGGVFGAGNFWTGANWDWFGGDPPFTQLTSAGGRPAGANGSPTLATHWAVRRYVSEAEGSISITGRIAHASDWIYVTATGVAADSVVHIFLSGKGDGYIDDLKLVAGVVPEVGANLLPNGDFEASNLDPWKFADNLSGSATSTTVKHAGAKSLHIVSTGAGGQSSASIKQTISPSLNNGQTYTLSYWYLPATNSTPLIVQTKGRWINTTPAYCSDGTVARIFVDGTQVFQQTALVSSSNYSLTVGVRFGSRVDFALDAGGLNRDACDDTTFTALIRTAPPVPVMVADSAVDWSVGGTQGEKNWFYGYYDQTGDLGPAGYQANDFVPFPRHTGPHGSGNLWDGESWDWWNGNPPFDEIGERVMNPNGSNSGNRHWVIRRWLSKVSGSITVDWSVQKLTDFGSGVTARIFHKGTLKDSTTLSGTAVNAVNRSILITGVQVGDAIDLALDPLGSGSNADDIGDRSVLSAVLRGSPNLTACVSTSLEVAMRNVNASAYVRLPFVVADPAAIDFLSLRMKYDDGFIAYLNGQQVGSANAPMLPAWNATATANRSDAAGSEFEEFNLTSVRGLLHAGTNVLAIHGLNASAADSDFLILPELIATRVMLDSAAARYFALPTPGAANGYGTTNLGPLIASVSHRPSIPKDHEDLVVTARVLPTFNPMGSVRLIYRVMFGGEANVAMFDDGLHGDGAAGDGLFGGVIPAGASAPGEMVRYCVFASDAGANNSRFPAFDDPQNSPQYQGTVVFNTGLTNPLPVLHQFVQNPVLATNLAGTRCSLFYDGEFYDNVFANLHGQTTTDTFDKRSMNIDLNSGHGFRWRRGAKPVHDFNLITTAADKAHMRHVLSYEIFAEAGVPGHFAFPVRLQQNNAFFGVMHVIENGDDDFLERSGLDPDGALYKMYLPLTDTSSETAEKKTRKHEGNTDLQGLIDGCALSGPALRNYLYDNIDLPEVINFLATIQIVQNEDCCDTKNYYLYRDSDGTREWQMLPWDLDLSLGRTFTSWVFRNGVWTGGYYDTNIFWINRYYSQSRSTRDFIGVDHPLPDALWSVPEIFEMFLRRWTTVQEELLQPPATHPLRLKFERRVDELAAQLAPDAALDLAKWGTFAPTQTLPVAAGILKTNYFAARRGWIFNTLAYANGGPYLGPPPANPAIYLAGVEASPASGNQAQEYIILGNPHSYAVDLSGWKISGAIDYTFRAGVVIPGGSPLYVSPEVSAFRARASGPRGGQGLFVQGNYRGQLSARGEGLQLTDQTGRVVSGFNYPGNPSPAQQYLRVTEIMYHPAPPPPGLATTADEFEFIEVKNIGPAPLSLAGVHFTNGVEFDFSDGVITSLVPGASAVVVRNLAAFTSRYGAGLNVAGQYAGSLDNRGESIRLDDAVGEKILDFSYHNHWYPVTDGVGFSLVIVNENAPWDSWGLKSSWRPGGSVGGTPGLTNPPPVPPPGLLITEALTHTALPELDRIEIHNPTAGAVDINGWYLTDDFQTPRKFRIHDRPLLPPGGYLAFDENDFNSVPGALESFSLSSKGDEVFLFSADAAGQLTGYYHGFAFGAAASGIAFGRHVTSEGREHFVAQFSPTLGGANSGPRVGPVVLSEIHHHPVDAADGSDDSSDEFVELQNITGASVDLFDPLVPANTWFLHGGVEFAFPANVTLAPGGFLLVVNFDPADTTLLAAFRSQFGVTAAVPIFGPLRGKLDNSSGSVKVSKPDAPVAGEVPYLLMDEVDYIDSAPWPDTADGSGASLQRFISSQYGNEPANWFAAAPTAGQPNGGGAAPVITVQPASQIVIASGSPTFSVSANGSGLLRYQWRCNGTNLPNATNASVTLANVLNPNAGLYDVVVFNRAGSVVSSNALLTVLYGAFFTRQPTNVAVAPGAIATFSAAALSSTPLRYQWRWNGANLPGATNATLTLGNVQPAQSGFYQIVATDSVGSLPSASALLTVLGPPFLTAQPQPVTVASGYTASFTVTATGTPLLSYQWRLNGVNLSGATTATLTMASVQPADAGDYSVVVNNSLGAVTSLVTRLTLLDGDTDGDGMSDFWEITHGFDPFKNDAGGDPDHDGVTNYQEYVSGTDPQDADSYLKIDALAVAPGASLLSFLAVSNKTYTVQYREAADIGTWLKLADVPARSTNRVEVITDSDPGGASRFYRLATPVQP